MSSSYVTVEEIGKIWRTLSTAEAERAETLIPLASSELTMKVKKLGYDLATLAENDKDIANVAKQIVCDAVARALNTPEGPNSISQFSQSAGGYSVSGTFMNAGDGLWIPDNALKKFGFTSSRIKFMEYDNGLSNNTNNV